MHHPRPELSRKGRPARLFCPAAAASSPASATPRYAAAGLDPAAAGQRVATMPSTPGQVLRQGWWWRSGRYWPRDGGRIFNACVLNFRVSRVGCSPRDHGDRMTRRHAARSAVSPQPAGVRPHGKGRRAQKSIANSTQRRRPTEETGRLIHRRQSFSLRLCASVVKNLDAPTQTGLSVRPPSHRPKPRHTKRPSVHRLSATAPITR
jgi:hypothetical protein